MTSGLGRLSATTIAALVRAGELTATEVAREHLQRVATTGIELGAVWQVTVERAEREAAAVDATVARRADPGPLAGVPVAWKDLIDTAGVPTTYGSPIFADHVPTVDADVVAALARSGAVTVAKLATDEFAWGTTTENVHFGRCANPHDRERTPGGSSGGSGAAVAAGIVPLAPGTDTGGSIRCPAACCGVVGVKPTFGRVSLSGIRPLASTLDSCGPIARTVEDCALVLELLAGASPRDPRTPPVPVPGYRRELTLPVAGLTVGVAERFFFEHADADVAAPVSAAIEALRRAGCRIVEVDLGWPAADVPEVAYYLAEQAATLVEEWPERADELGPVIAADIAEAGKTSGIALAAMHAGRLAYAARARAEMDVRGVDVVITPAQAFAPPLRGTSEVVFAGARMSLAPAMCTMTEIFNVLGWPAVSVPCGRDALGLPVGAQIAGRAWDEGLCLRVAAAIEHEVGPVVP